MLKLKRKWAPLLRLSSLRRFSSEFTQFEQNVSMVQLKDRRVLALKGQDSTSFLQGLIANDMGAFSGNQKIGAIYSAFLNAKGRMITDAIIAKPHLEFQDEETEYWLDLHQDSVDLVVSHFKKHALRKKVFSQDISAIIKSYALFTKIGIDGEPGHIYETVQNEAHYEAAVEGSEEKGSDVIAFIDPRSSILGARILCPEGMIEVDEENTEGSLSRAFDEYECHRIFHGFASGSQELNGKLPLNFNMAEINGVHFEKGCYLGQELTQRTYRTGVVRRRLLPFIALNMEQEFPYQKEGLEMSHVINQEFQESLIGQQLTSNDGVVLGKVVCSKYNIGLAECNIMKLQTKASSGAVYIQDKLLQCYVFTPFWLAETIEKDLERLSEQ